MAFLRKHASPLALLAVLAGLVAAPYLVPENPDSAAFRSGVFGTLLLLACFFPLRRAFSRADRRTLILSACLGLLLGCALGLGAELRYYGGLLPGAGSLLRRAAVPFLAAPLIGGLAAYAMLPRAVRGRSPRLPPAAYAAILLLCWLPLLLAYYPGMLNYDFFTEYQQFLDHQWDSRHPLLYLVISYAVLGAGRLAEQPTLAVLALTLARMLSLAAALAYSCVFAQRRGAPAWALALMTAAYALLPVFPAMAVSSAKDTPFSAALVVLSLLCWALMEDPERFLADRRRCAAFVLMAVLTCHLRKNGVAALAMLPLLLPFARGYRRKAARLLAVSAAAALLLAAGMNVALRPARQPSFQLYSLPAQQLVRAYHLGDLTQAERDEIRGWYVADEGLALHPHLADAAKGYLDEKQLRERPGDYLALWARIGRKCPRLYAEAFLLLNIGSWYPDDLTHATVYRDAYGLTKGYLQTDEYDLSAHGVRSRCLLPGLRRRCERMLRLNEYQKYPIVTALMGTATPLWAILLACAALIAQRRGRMAVSAAGVLALWLSYLFGPCTLTRYMLPLFCLAPVLLALAFSAQSKEAFSS